MVFGVCLSEVLLLVMGGVFVGDEEQKWVRFGWFSRGLEEAVQLLEKWQNGGGVLVVIHWRNAGVVVLFVVEKQWLLESEYNAEGWQFISRRRQTFKTNFYKTTYFFLYLFIFWPKSEIFSHQKINSPPLTFDQIVT